MKRLGLLFLLLMMFGCGPERAAPAASATVRTVQPRPTDPAPLPTARRMLMTHRMFVSLYGADAAWSRVDETAVDAADRDRLWANGLRVGIGNASDLEELARTAGGNQVESRTSIAADLTPQRFDVLMPSDEEAARQMSTTVFWHDDQGLGGRTFGPASLSLAVTYAPTPGGGGAMTRLSLVPRVQSSRGQTRFTATGRDAVRSLSVDEALTAARVTVDIPDGGYLLVSASPEAGRDTTIGGQWFRPERQDEEVLLLFVPQRATLTRASAEQ